MHWVWFKWGIYLTWRRTGTDEWQVAFICSLNFWMWRPRSVGWRCFGPVAFWILPPIYAARARREMRRIFRNEHS